MARNGEDQAVALGFRVRTGRASAVALAAPVSAPRVVAHRELQIHDPLCPESFQPYHAALDRSGPEGGRVVGRATEAARAAAVAAVDGFVGTMLAQGAAVVSASDTDPATIANAHMRAHAAEGQLFPVLVVEALAGLRIPSGRIVEREVEAAAAAALGRPVGDLKRELARMGREAGPPWRALEKVAALAAWIVLARGVAALKPARTGRAGNRTSPRS